MEQSMSGIYEAIERLPDNPANKIIWVCYNEAMTKSARALISLIKGEDYLRNCDVVSRDNLDPNEPNVSVYYSPDLYDHIGNGAN